jgi:hypothetical protein
MPDNDELEEMLGYLESVDRLKEVLDRLPDIDELSAAMVTVQKPLDSDN